MQAGSKKIEILKDKLYWLSDAKTPRGEGQAFFFCIDEDLVYQPFFKDFGPLNLGNTYRFVTELEKLLTNKDYAKSKIIHYTTLDVAKRANAAYLMGAFQIMVLKKTALEAWAPFAEVEPPFKPFRDASYTNCSYQCTILHCLTGLEYAISLGWFDLRTFNIKEYEHYEDIDHGDLNWIVPNKFVAFCTPSDKETDQYMPPEEYAKIFKSLKVTAVVRLNNPLYDGKKFNKAGINHYSLEYEDGSCPDEDKWAKFLEIAEKEECIAVHCKAGLGRTGSMIALYCMKHFRFPAAAFIGWIRICRPGSVLGPQQQWLNMMQDKMFALGESSSPIQKALDKDIKSLSARLAQMNVKQHTMNDDERRTFQHGQAGQGDFLTQQRHNR